MEIVVGIITVIVSSIVAFLLARKYGDLAGTKAAIEFEKEKADKARLDALNSLLHEVERARSLANHNSAIKPTAKGPRSVVRMPVTAFETVFLSGDSPFPSDNENVSVQEGVAPVSTLRDAISSYVTKAYAINLLIEMYIALARGLSSAETSWRQTVLTQIINESKEFPPVLNKIEKGLKSYLHSK